MVNVIKSSKGGWAMLYKWMKTNYIKDIMDKPWKLTIWQTKNKMD
jgi:hypothetical protein